MAYQVACFPFKVCTLIVIEWPRSICLMDSKKSLTQLISMTKYFTFISILLFINLSCTGNSTQFKYKLKVLKKEEGFIGCFGDNCKATCSQSLFIMEDSSLSFPCDAKTKVNKFTENYMYVFLAGQDYFVCPIKSYLKEDCIICPECSFKVDQMQKMNVK